LAYLEQAQDFYTAAVSAGIAAARPLLLYYCFLNLAKGLILHRGIVPTLPQVGHGLKERLRQPGAELRDAYLIAEKSPNQHGHKQVFSELLKTIAGAGVAADHDYPLMHLLPQVVSGHRLWAEAADSQERFVAINDIEIVVDEVERSLWCRIFVVQDDIKRLGLTNKQLLTDSGLAGLFKQVKTSKSLEGRKLACFEQAGKVNYRQRASDNLSELSATMRNLLWVTVASVPPYRRYYLYVCPAAERDNVIPQLLSIYALTFYLGSITRYRPHHFDKILEDDFGARIEEFIGGQTLQFIYLIASEFAEQDVTKPSIV
jgi:hypothetical protein